MPSDGSGVFSLPAGYLAVTGQTILASQHNPPLEDISDALTVRLMRSGVAPMTGVLKIVDGSASAPGLAFNTAPTSGWFKTSNGFGFSNSGASIFQANADTLALPSGSTAGRPAVPAAGMFRFNSDTGTPEFYGTTWVGLQASLGGSQMSYGAIINGTIAESHTGNAVTFALKTLAGTDPSVTDPVLIAFRNPTIATGNYVYRTVTAALSLVLSSGSTLGTTNNTPFKVWLVLFDDAGTVRIGAINTVSGTNIYPLGQAPLASSTAEGGAGAADSAQVFYTGTAVTTKAYVPLGYASYESGLAAAGSWASTPTRIQLFGAGVPLPGTQVGARVYTSTTTVGSTTSASFVNLTNGFTLSITPTSATNIIEASALGTYGNTNNAVQSLQLVRGSTLIGFPVQQSIGTTAVNAGTSMLRALDAPGVTTSTTYQVQGKTNAGTLSYPVASSGADLSLIEIMT